ncbi:hypothetical protein [Vibrio salinus]|uniref:hypothetical protein n=1 Tax=Vibrio salinus TaxID=2899784 RepID=UPI001E52ADCA|nr:hypothetical protein [Vibrio salinus]MCE0494649.1 hypothetical protein [Vibrio salinus]
MLYSEFHSDASDKSKRAFLRECNDMLRKIDPTSKAKVEKDEWTIPFSKMEDNKSSNLNVTLNFSDFKRDALKFKDYFSIQLNNNESVVVNALGFSKWFLLKIISDKSLSYRSKWVLDILKMQFAFLTERLSTDLNESNLEDFFSLLLTHDFENGGFIRRLSAPAYASRLKFVNLVESARILRSYGIEELVGNLTSLEINTALNEACLAQIDMTLADYKEGGSFDFLTLDVGRYYIDYCASFFEAHVAFSTALSNALVDVGLNVSESGNSNKWNDCLDFSTTTLLTSKLVKQFRGHYNNIVYERTAFNLSTIEQITSELGLDPNRFDTYEFVRAMLYSKFYEPKLKKREFILAEYLATLKNESTDEIVNFTLADFDSVCDNLLLQMKIDESESVALLIRYATKFNLTNRLTVEKFLLDVESAGITFFVALTGWRRGEYGFTVAALKSEVNKDIKDAVYTPFRFYLKWISPKTNGDTLLRREITLSASVLVRQLDALTKNESNFFAMSSKPRKESTDIGQIIYDAVTRLWFYFPFKYQLFNDLDNLQCIDGSVEFKSGVGKKQYLELKKKYNLENGLVKDLISLRDKLRNDVTLQELSVRSYSINKSTVRFEETLNRFINNTLDEADRMLLERNLSQDTLTALNSIKLTMDVVASIKNELLADTYSVSPHALRHIWAESVLRRYKGDVGKFIRANFKHIDERFFMAYLRNKEAKSIMDIAKRTTINSVVRHRIKSLKDEKRVYSGGFDRFINKAAKITKVLTQSEYESLSNDIAESRIIDISPKPWSTCLPRKGTSTSAKCSVDGILQRYNASPSLCLGCINADIEEGNFEGIVIYVKPDVEACRNPDLPAHFKKYHLETVKTALKRVLELEAGSNVEMRFKPFINHLQESIEIANRSIRGD